MANGYLLVQYIRDLKYPNGNPVTPLILNGEKRYRAWNNGVLINDETITYNNTEITDSFIGASSTMGTPGMMRIEITGNIIVTVEGYKDTSYVWSMDYTCHGPATVIETDREDVSLESGTSPLPNLFWPEDRPDDYDPDKKWAWDVSEGEYAWATGGGGRYRNQLIAIGFDSNGIGVIYFGDI